MKYVKATLAFLIAASSQNIFAQSERPSHHQQPISPKTQTDDPHTGHKKMGMKKHSYPMSASDCSEMEVFDPTMSMCMPFPMEGMPMKMLMFTGNAFLVGSNSEGPRGKKQISSPNMFMFDVGTTIGDRHYINLDLMGTTEKWTFPERGYPLLLQIGEADAEGRAYLDAQHPHSSPIMGITLSDTIRLGNGKDHLKLFIAPRGSATDGPIAFMHRPTGIANPDAPLSHHLAQDVGHISGTVIGGSLALKNTRLQLSVFDGTEPEPDKVDLPVRTPNSWATRVIQDFTPKIMGMASVAYVKEPEGKGNEPDHQWRLSTSVYSEHELDSQWTLYNALIYGYITDYEHASALSSVAQELWLKGSRPRIWSRIEFVQRTPYHLQISTDDPNRGRWVSAFTLGYIHALAQFETREFAVGASATKNFVPDEFESAYGGDPWAAKIFLQIRGMEMWSL